MRGRPPGALRVPVRARRGAGLSRPCPSWTAWQIQAETGFDLFTFGDQPIVEKLNFNRTFVEGEEK
ncbi:hypothetical protein [uncultured Kocuria sp.]|uniref:hypothetical protein n=1 Tax=uncultured Kocuria sp. TaxID=259305 RepID=UPI00343BFC57